MSYNSHHTGKNTELKKDDKATVDISQSLRSHHMLYCVEKNPNTTELQIILQILTSQNTYFNHIPFKFALN